MGSKHKNLAGLEETRLLRDFEKYGYDPEIYQTEFYDGEFGEEDHAHDGWIMFSPKDANQILEELWMWRDLQR